MSGRLNKTVLSSVYFETVRVCREMHAHRVGGRSFDRQGPETVKLWSIGYRCCSGHQQTDPHVLLNGDYSDQI